MTVAELAEAAGVSEKTIFNYFATKEDLLSDEVPEREAELVDAVRNRTAGESVVAAVRRLQEAQCPRLASEHFAAFARIIDDSPDLGAKELEVMARFERILAATLEEGGIREIDARVAATLLVGVQWELFQLARERALAGRHAKAAERRLRADIARAYELLERGLGDLG